MVPVIRNTCPASGSLPCRLHPAKWSAREIRIILVSRCDLADNPIRWGQMVAIGRRTEQELTIVHRIDVARIDLVPVDDYPPVAELVERNPCSVSICGAEGILRWATEQPEGEASDSRVGDSCQEFQKFWQCGVEVPVEPDGVLTDHQSGQKATHRLDPIGWPTVAGTRK